jgi:hypothetical protein
MKKLITLLAFGLSAAMAPAFGADAVTQTPKIGGKPSMLVEGRFHKIHEKIAKQTCKDCHALVQKDILYLRKDDTMPPKMGEVGQSNRKSCLICHKPGYLPNLTRSYWGI